MRAGLLIGLLLVVCSLSGAWGQSGDAQLLAAINKAIEVIVNSPSEYASVLTLFGGQASDRVNCPFDAMSWPCNPVGTLANTLSSGVLSLCISAGIGPAYSADGSGWEQIMGGLVAKHIGEHYGVTLRANWTLVNSTSGFFTSMKAAVDSGVCDAVFSDVTIKYSRTSQVDFTCSYAGDFSGYAVLSANASQFQSISSLNAAQYSIAIKAGVSEVEELATVAPLATLVYVPDTATGLQMVLSGAATAYVADYPDIVSHLSAYPSLTAFTYGAYAPSAAFTRLATADVQPSCPSAPSCPNCVCPSCPACNCCNNNGQGQGQGTSNELNFVFANMIPAN
jgi:hypothetical protein